MLHLCSVCNSYIHDFFVMVLEGKSFHADCLRCHMCKQKLDDEEHCYVKDNRIYCKIDYYEVYSKCVRCSGCVRPVFPGHWMRKATSEMFYHLTCFCCVLCKRQLSTGEQYGLSSGSIYCLIHYNELLAGPEQTVLLMNKRKKQKRVRTTFSEQQIAVLHKTFRMEANPDAGELERLSEITSLSKRVIQVWFQNARARHKKFLTAILPSAADGIGASPSADETLCNRSAKSN